MIAQVKTGKVSLCLNDACHCVTKLTIVVRTDHQAIGIENKMAGYSYHRCCSGLLFILASLFDLIIVFQRKESFTPSYGRKLTQLPRDLICWHLWYDTRFGVRRNHEIRFFCKQLSPKKRTKPHIEDMKWS